jgi:hypothetical protein
VTTVTNVEAVSFLYGLCAGLVLGLVMLFVVLWAMVRASHRRQQ